MKIGKQDKECIQVYLTCEFEGDFITDERLYKFKLKWLRGQFLFNKTHPLEKDNLQRPFLSCS